MPLEVSSRSIGDVTVLTSRGRLVEADSAPLALEMDALLSHRPNLVLNLAGVTSIDSSGLGFLVRYLARASRARGGLKLSTPSPKVEEALRITRIASSFDIHPSDDDAVTAFYRGGRMERTPSIAEADVLVAEASHDVQAYLRELLRQAGFCATTAGNLPDALILLRAIAPRAVVIGESLRAMRSTATGEAFNSQADEIGVVELPGDFSTRDAGEAGRRVLDDVRNLLARR